MESLEGQYGFDDHLFLSETPDYLRCVVCSLVLRDPVQILTCGHKFCSHCFDRMKKYAETKNTEFCCPVDRDVVDMSKVHEDIAVKRAVGNLKVHCEAHEDGCSWNGELSDLEKHSEQCSYQQQKHLCKGISVANDERIRDLYSKVARCETWMADKEREMADKDKEIIVLKHQVQQLKEELCSTKQHLQGEFATKYEVAGMKKEIKELKEEILSTKQHRQGEFATRDEVTGLKNEIKELKDALKAQSKSLQTSSAQLVTLQQGNNLSYESTSILTDGKKLNSKNIFIQHCRGDHKDIVLSAQNNYCVEFKEFSTVSISNVFVGKGTKVWYEVKYYEMVLLSGLYVGWASNSLTKIDHHVEKGVGDVSQSYGFNPILGHLWFKGDCEYDEGCHQDSDNTTNENYVGVALDMVEGAISYSMNGVWNQPEATGIGINFHQINLKTEFFPAISGLAVTVEVNFGDRAWHYGPPDDSYRTLVEIA